MRLNEFFKGLLLEKNIFGKYQELISNTIVGQQLFDIKYVHVTLSLSLPILGVHYDSKPGQKLSSF